MSGAGFGPGGGPVALPVPTPGGVLGPNFWDARIAPTDQVVYFTNPNPSNTALQGVVPNDARLTNYSSVQAGMTNPLNNAPANLRVTALAPFGSIAARPQLVTRFRNWSTDLTNKNTGQNQHPASSTGSAYNVGIYPNGNWNYYLGFSLGLPSGTGANGFPVGDNAFPPNVRGFCQLFEPFGSGFGSPALALNAISGGYLFGGAPTRPDLSGNTNNFWCVNPPLGSLWVDANPISYDTWYDFIFHIQWANTASPDGGANGGLAELWMNGVKQTWLPGSSEGGWSGAGWTRVNAGQTVLMRTTNSGGGTGYTNLDMYRGVTSPNEPVTTYLYAVGTGSTLARVDPSTH